MHPSDPFSIRHIKAYGEFKAHLQMTNKYYQIKDPFWHIFGWLHIKKLKCHFKPIAFTSFPLTHQVKQLKKIQSAWTA
jgi:hypothetical protein